MIYLTRYFLIIYLGSHKNNIPTFKYVEESTKPIPQDTTKLTSNILMDILIILDPFQNNIFVDSFEDSSNNCNINDSVLTNSSQMIHSFNNLVENDNSNSTITMNTPEINSLGMYKKYYINIK